MTWREFLRFVELASVAELLAKRDEFYELRRRSKDAEMRRWAQGAIKEINAELAARAEVAAVEGRGGLKS